MAEAGDMARCLVFPPSKENEQLLYPAHEQLVNRHGGKTICTIPISNGVTILGALILDRELPFAEETVQWCEAVGNMAGLILDLKQQSERGLIKHAVITIQRGLYKTFGPKHGLWKLNSLLLLSVAVFLQ
ncbi:MAG: hypothetical protein HC877_16165 [Thioploca sp.]|nr:hypothetical protein [Thioploca sp.]